MSESDSFMKTSNNKVIFFRLTSKQRGLMEDDYPQVVLGSKLFNQRIFAVQLSSLLNCSSLIYRKVPQANASKSIKVHQFKTIPLS